MSTVAGGPTGTVHRSLAPARMDRLPWCRFHWLVIVGLGVAGALVFGRITDRLRRHIPESPRWPEESITYRRMAKVFFALGNLAGPLLLGNLFDSIGRRKMILLSYGFSGVLLLVSAFFFRAGVLNATTQTAFWCVTFFFASAGASSAYLTVSEIFPLELRAQAIRGYVIGAVVMMIGGAVGWFLGVNAERQSLENVAPPISARGTSSAASSAAA